MTTSADVTSQRIHDLVIGNRAIRAPEYAGDHDEGVQFSDPKRGLQWGEDAIPALMGLFRVERDPRDNRRDGDDHPEGWVGFARHWRGATLRLDFDLIDDPEASDPVLVVTAVSGRNADGTLADQDFGDVELPGAAPTKEDWDERVRRYQAARRADDDHAPAAVKAYIAALPGWKREVATQLDAIIEREAPNVRRAIKWHIPFYGSPDQGWFASIAAFSKYVKLTFLRGTSLDPEPPVEVRNQEARCLHVKETDALDEEQLASWVRQAAAIPGEFA